MNEQILTKNNPQSEEKSQLTDIPTITGDILIDFLVKCPHCDLLLFLNYDREWFYKTMGPSFPTDGVNGDYEAKCPKCNKNFIVNGFNL